MSNRRVTATLHRRNCPLPTVGSARGTDEVWTRQYSYFDTAMPRAVQLLMSSGQTGDTVVFHSIEFGFELGQLHMASGRRIVLTMSELALSSPNLMKLMQES